MFRLFRRKGKEKKEISKKKEEDEESIKEVISPVSTEGTTQIESTQESNEVLSLPSEKPFEEKFEILKKVSPETIVEDTSIVSEYLSPPRYIESILNNEIDSYDDFISPEMFMESTKEKEDKLELYFKPKRILPPITLEERIEGALFSIGRPIHADELIEFLQEESPVVKRAIRKVSRNRKKNSPIVIEEISKDRWVLQLNPLYHDFFQMQVPHLFMEEDVRRILTEIAYRQPISVAMVKKIVKGIGPLRINEICKQLEDREYIIGETRARSSVYTTTPKFAHDFGFDNESRRLKLQMLWRLRRLMGDWESEEEEDIETVSEEEEEKDEESETAEVEPEAEEEEEKDEESETAEVEPEAEEEEEKDEESEKNADDDLNQAVIGKISFLKGEEEE